MVGGYLGDVMETTGSYDEVTSDEHKRCFIVNWLWDNEIGAGVFTSRQEAHDYIKSLKAKTPAIRYLLMSVMPKEGKTIEPSLTVKKATPMAKWLFDRVYETNQHDNH